MRAQVILVVTTLAVLGVLAAALPLGKGDDVDDAAAGGATRIRWPCCDNCGTCNRKNPPDCSCRDVSLSGCHPRCKKCVVNFVPVVTYRCTDILTNFCRRRCTPAPAAIQQLVDA